MSRLRKITAAVSAVAVLGAGGIGVAARRHEDQRPRAPLVRATSAAARCPPPSSRRSPRRSASRARSSRRRSTRRGPPSRRGERPDRGAGLATALATALNVDVAKVKEILDANRPAKPAAGAKRSGARPAKPSNTKLIAALASGLGIDTATVKAAFDTIEAAHKAEHEAREQAMYAAVAKELGLTADAVEAAFEANRPAKPRARPRRAPAAPRPARQGRPRSSTIGSSHEGA